VVVVFIRKSAGRAGATKVQIAERRGGRNHILEHVGTARSEAELAVLMAEARRRLRPGQETLDLGDGALEQATGLPERPGVITGKRSALLWQVLTSVYARLGFDAVEDAAFAQLVLARIIEPTSKADSVRVLDEIGVPHASLRTMFRSLQRAAAGGYRDQIATACFTHTAAKGDVSLCLYDVTTLYFEAENEDELRKVGYSKERRVDPQIVVGLLVDRAGFPLELGCWEGNTAETTTMIPIIKQFRPGTHCRTWSWSPTPGCCRRPTSRTCTRPGCGSSSAPASRRRRPTSRRTSAGTETRSPTDRSSTPSPRGWPPPPPAMSTT
jgi:hypothetical protein